MFRIDSTSCPVQLVFPLNMEIYCPEHHLNLRGLHEPRKSRTLQHSAEIKMFYYDCYKFLNIFQQQLTLSIMICILFSICDPTNAVLHQIKHFRVPWLSFFFFFFYKMLSLHPRQGHREQRAAALQRAEFKSRMMMMMIIMEIGQGRNHHGDAAVPRALC